MHSAADRSASSTARTPWGPAPDPRRSVGGTSGSPGAERGPRTAADRSPSGAEAGRTDEDDPGEARRMFRGGDDHILPRQRERHDVDGGLSRLHDAPPDALELLPIEFPAIGRVGPIR